MKLIPCPACPAKLQVVEPSTSYASNAHARAIAEGVELPVHGPAALTLLSLVAHATVVHPELQLRPYLEAYLDS